MNVSSLSEQVLPTPTTTIKNEAIDHNDTMIIIITFA